MSYFLLSSGTLFAVLGAVFFGLGLWLGHLLWGGYKERVGMRERELSSARSRVQALQVELRKLQQEGPPAAADCTELEARHRHTLDRLKEQETLHQQALERVQELEAMEERLRLLEAGEAEAAPVANQATDQELARLHQQMRQLEADLEMEKGDNASLNADLSATARRAEQAEQRVNSMMRERDALLDELRELQSQQLAAQMDAASDEPAAEAAHPGDVSPATGNETAEESAASPDQADDLTRIKGIGKVLQEKLNGFGIHTFHQIAAWNDEQIADFANRLGFKERIQRDDWVGQARRLQQEDVR